MTFEIDAVVISGDLGVEPDDGIASEIPVKRSREQEPHDGGICQRPFDGSFQSHFHRP